MISDPPQNSKRMPRPRSGILVCVVIGIFASLVMTAFFVASKMMHRDRAPAQPVLPAQSSDQSPSNR
jgi:hypothetical protein